MIGVILGKLEARGMHRAERGLRIIINVIFKKVYRLYCHVGCPNSIQKTQDRKVKINREYEE